MEASRTTKKGSTTIRFALRSDRFDIAVESVLWGSFKGCIAPRVRRREPRRVGATSIPLRTWCHHDETVPANITFVSRSTRRMDLGAIRF